jgi:ATP-dependent Clp protease protease subunit
MVFVIFYIGNDDTNLPSHIQSLTHKNTMSKEWFKIVNNADCPTIYVTGYFGEGEEVDYNILRALFDSVRNSPRVKCVVNTGGGDMVQGYACYDHVMQLKEATGMKVDMNVIGMAGSMGSIFIMAGDTISMSPNSLIMIHRPQAGAFGESQVLRDMADLSDKMEGMAIAVYMKRTGLPEAKIKEWMSPGKMTWFTATEAFDNKLIDQKPESNTDSTPIPKPSNNLNEKGLWNTVYNKIDLNLNTPTMKLPKLTLDKLSLKDDHSETELVNAVESVLTENTTLKEKIRVRDEADKLAIEAKATKLVDDAITAKKITSADKETYKKFAINDYDAAKDILNKLQPVALPGNVVKTGDGKKANPEDRSEWDYKKWSKEDPKGLAAMKANDTEAFDALLEAQKTAVKGKLNIG